MARFKEEDNPYTLQFSFIPPKFIERRNDTDNIISNFVRPVPTYRGMFITGVRGSGKTVMLSTRLIAAGRFSFSTFRRPAISGSSTDSGTRLEAHAFFPRRLNLLQAQAALA